MKRPIIQGGMGVYISTPFLARACSLHADVLGTVSCVAAERILPRILQSGDVGGHFRRALAHFPFPRVTERITAKYFVDGGISEEKKFKSVPIYDLKPNRHLIELSVASSFAFVWLAKEGHENPVSVNYLEKIQIPHIYHLAGAMLAGVDYVTMGAGITLQIPGVLDALAGGRTPEYRVTVEGSHSGGEVIRFDPTHFFGEKFPELARPGFLPIVSTDVLATLMTKRLPKGSIQGFVVEQPTAGGHNAPPRGKVVLSEQGEPIYGERDVVAFQKLLDLGIPFWVGGALASPQGLAHARALGATGIQAGTIFALAEESGMLRTQRREVMRLGYRGELHVRTEPMASPTGFPFKVAQVGGTLSDPSTYAKRERLCDLCLLRVPFRKDDESIGYRCSAEPVLDYVKKGGKAEDTVGVRCLCNGLISLAGFGNPQEPPIVTLGDDVGFLRHLMKSENDTYTVDDAVRYLMHT